MTGKVKRFIVTTVREDEADRDADNPERLLQFWNDVVATQPDYEADKESVIVVLLNTRLRAFAWHRVSLGMVNEASAHPREVMRPVITGGAYAFALMHNHPSGDPSPSRADDYVTRRIVEASQLMQIRIMDHVIVGRPSPGRSAYYSFREAGLIP